MPRRKTTAAHDDLDAARAQLAAIRTAKRDLRDTYSNAERLVNELRQQLVATDAHRKVAVSLGEKPDRQLEDLTAQLATAEANLKGLGDYHAQLRELDRRERDLTNQIGGMTGDRVVDLAEEIGRNHAQPAADALRTALAAAQQAIADLSDAERKLLTLVGSVDGLTAADVRAAAIPADLAATIERVLDRLEPPRLRVAYRDWNALDEDTMPAGLRAVRDAVADGRLDAANVPIGIEQTA
jgi:chromosome segregation ATPase